MSKRILKSLLVTWLVLGTLWAADDPFVGRWKLNPSKTNYILHRKIKGLGGNKYALELDDDFGESSIVADGTDQPSRSGTTLSITVEGPHTWKVVRKKGGTFIDWVGIWELSQDGKT